MMMHKVHFTHVGPSTQGRWFNQIFSWYLYVSIWFILVFTGYVQQLKLVMDSIIWAFRHTERNIAETGLNLLLEMLKNFQVYLSLLIFDSVDKHFNQRLTIALLAFQTSEFCNQFYRTYFLTIEQEIFAVLTDTFHKPGFKLHVLVLQHLFCLVTQVLFPFVQKILFTSGCSFLFSYTSKHADWQF